VSIEAIAFEGLSALEESEARAALGLSVGGLLDTLGLTDRSRRLEARLAEEGYLDAATTIRVVPAADPGRGRVTILVAEGARAVIGLVTQAGLDSLDGSIVPRLPMPPSGTPFRRADVERSIASWLDAYDEAGYPFARIRPIDVRVDRASSGAPRVGIALSHDPGPRVYLASIDLKGATVTQPSAVARVIGFKPGQVYRQSQIEEGVARLERAGLVAEVGPAELVPGDDPARSRLRLQVREAPSGNIAGIVGYSGLDQRLSGYLDFRLNNIAGTGRRIEARWSKVERASTLYHLGYREPFLFGRPIDLTVQLDHVIFDTLYTTTRSELAMHWLASGVLGLDKVVITSDVNRSESSGRFAGQFDHDARSPLPAPRAGWRTGLSLSRGKTLSGTYGESEAGLLSPILALGVRQEVYRVLSRSGVLVMLLTGRSIETNATPVPQYELLPLGGALTLRGYREEQFYTPGYLLGQFEYRLLADRNGSGVFLFTDVATFAPQEAEATLWPKFDLTKVGYGAGLRIGTRSGRLGLDYGLAAGEGPLEGRFNLRAETEF
ncbi:MAG: Outer membrane protein, partial [bacterium]